MRSAGEELVVGSRRARRPLWVVLAGMTSLLLATSLLTGEDPRRGCPVADPAPSPSPTQPWLTPDDPLVRGLHFAAADRARSSSDDPPAGVLPDDVRQFARKVAEADGIVVYLARQDGFACLGVASSSPVSSCLLDDTIANEGLTMTIAPTGSEDPVLVVALPEGASVVVQPTTERLAESTSVVVLRPHDDQVLLTLGDRAPMAVGEPYVPWGSATVRC